MSWRSRLMTFPAFLNSQLLRDRKCGSSCYITYNILDGACIRERIRSLSLSGNVPALVFLVFKSKEVRNISCIT